MGATSVAVDPSASDSNGRWRVTGAAPVAAVANRRAAPTDLAAQRAGRRAGSARRSAGPDAVARSGADDVGL